MKQQTFIDIEYGNRKRKTKREEFLEIMDEIIPWDEWVSIIVPFYPSGKRGRPPKGIEKMLRMYLLQVWFNLTDEGTEDAIYDSYAMRKSVRMNTFLPLTIVSTAAPAVCRRYPKILLTGITWLNTKSFLFDARWSPLFQIVGYKKVLYRGLAKNENRLYALFASANLYALASRGRSLAVVW